MVPTRLVDDACQDLNITAWLCKAIACVKTMLHVDINPIKSILCNNCLERPQKAGLKCRRTRSLREHRVEVYAGIRQVSQRPLAGVFYQGPVRELSNLTLQELTAQKKMELPLDVALRHKQLSLTRHLDAGISLAS